MKAQLEQEPLKETLPSALQVLPKARADCTHKVPQPPLEVFSQTSKAQLISPAQMHKSEAGTESVTAATGPNLAEGPEPRHSWTWQGCASSPQVTEMHQKDFLSFSCIEQTSNLLW